jgi:hypothetical protein
MSVEITNGENGERHDVHVEREAGVEQHPFLNEVHAAIQLAISNLGGIGIASRVGIPRSNVEDAIKHGHTDEEVGNAVLDMAVAQWANNAIMSGRVGHNTRTVELPDHGEAAVLELHAVVFTDEQFGNFLLDVEKAVLLAVDDILLKKAAAS